MTALPFRLETRWIPARDGEPPLYELKLANAGGTDVAGFTLGLSGPARIDPAATIDGGRLVARLSNHAELAPPEGFVLAAGGSWTLRIRGLSHPLRHWSDGATGAYLALADGEILPVAVDPAVAAGNNAPLRRGTQKFPVPGPGKSPVPISVIPWPAEVRVSGRRMPPPGFALDTETPAAANAAAAFTELTGSLFAAEGIVRAVAEGGLRVRLAEDPALGEEAYRIDFGETLAVHASGHAGFLYGLITLGHILRGARQHPETFTFPALGEIADAPAFGFRGSHLDVARQFYASAEIAQFLRLMAWSKLNRFHWHLSDDEAWRIEIDAYPGLTRIGAWRGHGLKIPPLLGSGPEPQGGFYSKPMVREIVALAGRFGITVIPEIDVPGHCFALQQSIPELVDPRQHGDYSSVQGFPDNCINPALEVTYTVVETIFDELIDLFPARIIHIGADEVPLGAWSGSPAALEKLRDIAGAAVAEAHAGRLGVATNAHGADDIEGSGAAILQSIFLKRLQAFLASRGCLTGGWEEVAHGDMVDKDKVYLVGWRSVDVSAALARRGYDVVAAPGQAYYLDMSQGAEWVEPGASWAGTSSLEHTYTFDPIADWTAEESEHFLGVQACIWSEPMTDRAVFDRLVFPRLYAIAEAGWTAAAGKSFARFSALCGLMPNLYGHWSE